MIYLLNFFSIKIKNILTNWFNLPKKRKKTEAEKKKVDYL